MAISSISVLVGSTEGAALAEITDLSLEPRKISSDSYCKGPQKGPLPRGECSHYGIPSRRSPCRDVQDRFIPNGKFGRMPLHFLLVAVSSSQKGQSTNKMRSDEGGKREIVRERQV